MDWINIAKEQVKGAGGKNYSSALHPSTFTSIKAKRGPLRGSWAEKTKPVMCAYKLVSVSFNSPRWTFPSKVERYIHQVLREIYLASHQLAFCSVDEWIGLSYQDVRKLELDSLQPSLQGSSSSSFPTKAVDSTQAPKHDAGPNSWSARPEDRTQAADTRPTHRTIIKARL